MGGGTLLVGGRVALFRDEILASSSQSGIYGKWFTSIPWRNDLGGAAMSYGKHGTMR